MLSEKHHTVIQKQETELSKSLSEAERGVDVHKLHLQKDLDKKQTEFELATIENKMYFNKEKTLLESK